MRRFMVLLALVSSHACMAQGIGPQKMAECNQQAMLVSMAASYRDSRQSPQQFMKFVAGKRDIFNALTDPQIKHTVNAVYFDDRLAGLPPQMLEQMVSEECLNPTPQYQPLQ